MIKFKDLLNILKLHDGIKRRGREPYVNHLVRVAMKLEELIPDNDQVHLLGMLHEVLEVTSMDMEAIKEGFNLQEWQCRILEVLTAKEGESSQEHFERCLASNLIYVLFIKYADNLDNMYFTEADHLWVREKLNKDGYEEMAKYMGRAQIIAERINSLCKKEIIPV